MFNRIVGATFVALTAFALPLAAQQKATTPAAAKPAAQAGPTAEQQAWITELNQIGQKLQTAQMKALQDPAISAAQNALGAEFKTAMEKQDPGLAGVAQRVQTMEAEARKAQENSDEAKLKQLTQEAQQIQMRFAKAQAETLKANPALATKAQAFEDRVEKKVIEIQPDAQALLLRGQELQAKLNASVQQLRAAAPKPGGQR